MQLTRTEPWGAIERTLTRESLIALVAGKVSAIHVDAFVSPGDCERFATASRDVSRGGSWAARTSPMQIIGGNFSNAVHMTPDEYFATVEGHESARDRVFTQSFDALARVRNALAGVWPGQVAIAEEARGRYFAGGIKLRTQPSPPHFDFVPYFTDRYAIGRIKEQLSFNVYFTMPAGTGHTDIYSAKVTSVPRRLKGFKANNVPVALLDGIPYLTLRPHAGDLVLFCTRHPHRVVMEDVAPDEPRIQLGCFLGLDEHDDLLMWS